MTIERDESGSALILALAIITAIGLMMSAILSFTDTSLLATPQFVSNRNTLYDVDGAVDGAINAVRGSLTRGTSGPSAPACPTFSPGPGVDKVTVTVECTGQAGVGGAATDQVPPYAVVLLGSEGLVQTGNAPLTIDGGLYSNGAVNLTTSGVSNMRRVQVYGDLLAEGDCSPVPNKPESISSVGGLRQCGNDTPKFTGNATGNDPGYTPAVSSISGMAVDPAATCASTNSLVVFSPGLYSEVPVAPTGCSGDVWWFQPGVYYFDFPEGRHMWEPDAKDIYVLGGTLASGLSAATNSQTVIDDHLGAACNEEATGVQFIFGGPSAVRIDAGGYMELCGSVATTNNAQHRIALYGLNDTHGPRVTKTNDKKLQDGTPSTAPGSEVTWVLPETAKTISETPVALAASATVIGNNTNKDTADLLVPSFADIPKGSAVSSASTSVKVRVRHWASSNSARPKLYLNLPALPDRAAKTIGPYDLQTNCSALSPCDQQISVGADIGPSFGYLDVNGMTATIKATVQGNGTVTQFVDGVELIVTHEEPGFEKLECPTAGCSVLATTVAQNVFFHGTVYVPTGSLDLRVHNKDTTIFDRGVVARTLAVNVSDSSKQLDSPFQLPVVTTSRTVLFVAKVEGVEKLRALVEYQDFKPGVGGEPDTVFPGYQVKVLSWSVLR